MSGGSRSIGRSGGDCAAAHVLVRWHSSPSGGDVDGALMEVARHLLASIGPAQAEADPDLAPRADVTCECWAIAPPGSARLPRALWRPSASSPIWFVHDGPTTHAVHRCSSDADARSIEAVPIVEGTRCSSALQAQIQRYGYAPCASVRFTGTALVHADGAAAVRVLRPRVDVGGGVAMLCRRPLLMGDGGAEACIIDVRAPIPPDALAEMAQKRLDGAVVVGGTGTGWRSDDQASVFAASAAIARKFALVADAVLMGR